MSLSISLFPNTAPIRNALAIAAAHPTSVSSLEPNVTLVNDVTGERVLKTDTFVVGRRATFNSSSLPKVQTIVCKTFLSLGTIKLDQLKVVADQIILVNSVDVDNLELSSRANLVAIGCIISGEGKAKLLSEGDVVFKRPILNHEVDYEDTILNGTIIDRRVVSEWHEDPIDASVRDIENELDRQDSWDLSEYTRETVAHMRMRSILV